MSTSNAHWVNSVVDLYGSTTCSPGTKAFTVSYHPPVFPSKKFIGGQEYVWVDDLPRSNHDGGTFISPTVPWDGTFANHPDFLAGVGETNPNADGCWTLAHPEEIYVEDYGAVGGASGSGSPDNYAAINAAVNRKYEYKAADWRRAGIVRLRETGYYVSQTLELKSVVDLRGAYSQLAGNNSYVMNFAEDARGIIIHQAWTLGDGTESPATTDAIGTKISGITLRGGSGSTDPAAHGIWLRARAEVRNVRVKGFGGNGINIVATAGSSDPSRVGNANDWVLDTVLVQGCGGHGIHVDGADVNSGCGMRVSVSSNGGWGIHDSSFLGNTWIGCHAASNNSGPYKCIGSNARSTFIGCYSEGDQPTSTITSPSISIGGLHAAGLEGYGGNGSGFGAVNLTAGNRVAVETKTSGQHDYVKAHNQQTVPNKNYEVGFMGYSAYKADGTTPRPLGGMYMRPGSSNRNNPSVLGWYTYTGEAEDELTGVAYFWGDVDLSPEKDNQTQMGWHGRAWRTIYLNHAPLVPADADLNENIAPLSTAEKNVATALKGLVRTYTRKADNDGVRHVGVIAEDVVTAFQNQGLDAYDYGVLEGGQRDHVRYEELLAFIIAAL